MRDTLAGMFIVLDLYIFGQALLRLRGYSHHKKAWFRPIQRALGGFALLVIWDIFAFGTGIQTIGLNALTLTVSGVLGIPGLLSLVAIRYGLS